MVKGPAGPETKNERAGKGQQQFTWLIWLWGWDRKTGPGTKNGCWQRSAAIYPTGLWGSETKNIVMGPAEPETMNDCTNKGQQPTTRPDQLWEKNMVMGPAGPENKNDCAGEGQQQITRPQLSWRVVTQLSHICETKKYGHATYGAWNQERLCCWNHSRRLRQPPIQDCCKMRCITQSHATEIYGNGSHRAQNQN
jgi:hypothetical protein